MGEAVNISMPMAGRLVQGDCFVGRKTNKQGQPLGKDAQGNDKQNFYIGVAIPKTDPWFVNELWPIMNACGKAGYPHLFNTNGECVRQDFSWKFLDGDTAIDEQGKPYSEREGFAGHYVLRFSSSFAPKVYTARGEQLITDPNMVKRGYYVRVVGSVKDNAPSQSPGVYLNMYMIELCGYGPEIVGGPDAQQAFATPALLPVGASTTPVASGAPLAPPSNTPGAPTPPVSTPPAPPVTITPTPQPGAVPPTIPQNIQPATNILNPPAPPAPAPPVTAPAAYTGVTMSDAAKAAGYTYEGLKGSGWSDQQMYDAGYITDIPF